ncbi:MAG: hypothetical protein V1729_04010 [Candidatus Woesearchaeota archaeon]
MRETNGSWMVKLILPILFITLLSVQASALGVGPSRQILSFTPGQEFEGELIIINDQGDDFRAAVYVQGDLSDYVTIENPLVVVSSSDTAKSIPYKVKFPIKSPRPGSSKIEIVVRQFPKDGAVDEGSVVSASMAVISQMIIKVPYPGKYAEGKLFISGTEKTDSPARFLISIYNFGTEDIGDAHAKIEILGPDGEKVDEFSTSNSQVKSKEEANLEALWTPNVNKGTYKAVVTVYFDEKTFNLEQSFDLGTFVIDVSDVSVEKFRLGDVAKFDILLFNSWNVQMKDVYVEMTIEDSRGNKMTELKTAAIDIPAQQVGTLESYWYTEGVAPGIYKVKLLVHYAGKMTQKEYDFEVDTNSITRLGAPIIGQVVTRAGDEEASMQGFLIVLILVVIALLLAMNIVWFYFLSKQFKKGGDK